MRRSRRSNSAIRRSIPRPRSPRKALVEPLALPAGVRRLLVSPDGAIAYVPFAALVSPNVAVALVPSGTVYGMLLEGGARRAEGVLALGDPDYGTGASASVSLRGARLLPLPGTREEAFAVGEVLLLGAEASEAGLRLAMAKRTRWRAIHFACHGLLDVERPGLSALALAPDAQDDGLLTALEAMRMDFPADLVVLSAAETARGRIVAGEGVMGLARAFLLAGSPRVIGSLWKVDDEATRALMTKFYELWNPKTGSPGLGTAEALRKAQEFVRSQEKWKHPYYWAAWVLWGLPS